MKIKITKTETQEIELSFPVYKKLDATYYKATGSNEWIEVFVHPSCGIWARQEPPYDVDKVISRGEDITEDEFNEKFIEVFNKIKVHKPQPKEKTESSFVGIF